MKNEDIIQFYNTAKEYCIDHGFAQEIKWVRQRRFENVDSDYFLHEYAFVVINSGMKNQVAEKIFQRFQIAFDLKTIGHLGKRKAIEECMKNSKLWFNALKEAEDKVEFLGTLPWIGKITKYHLARNVGIDVAKPDRHLVRLSRMFGFKDPQDMCGYISEKTKDRVGVVDVILWRYCNLNAEFRKKLSEFEEE